MSREEIDAERSPRRTAIYAAQAAESGKPAKIIEKMVVGRLEKFYKEVCLLRAAFREEPGRTVTQFLKEVGGKSWAARTSRLNASPATRWELRRAA